MKFTEPLTTARCSSKALSASPLTMFHRMLSRVVRETYGHALSVHLLTAASGVLLVSCVLYFLSPLLDDNYHLYQRFLPFVSYLDWSQYNSFVVDHVVVFLAISLPMVWLLLVNVAYSSLQTRVEMALLALRIACCLTMCFSLTVILSDFLSRRVMIAIISLAYGTLGLLYSWSVPLWQWYVEEAREKGFVAFLPHSMQHVLLRMTVLDWLTDRSLTDKVKQVVPFLLPLSKSEQNRVLEQLPLETQEVITRPGMLGFFPSSVQKFLLPSDAILADTEDRQAGDDEAHAESTTTCAAVKPLELAANAEAGFAFHKPEVESAALALKEGPSSQEEILMEIVSKRLWRGCSDLIHFPSPQVLDQTATVSAALFVLQLYASRRSRDTVLSILKLVMASSLLSVAGGAITIRFLQLSALRFKPWRVMIQYAQQYMVQLARKYARPQLEESEADRKARHEGMIKKSATTATVVVCCLYILRKLRR